MPGAEGAPSSGGLVGAAHLALEWLTIRVLIWPTRSIFYDRDLCLNRLLFFFLALVGVLVHLGLISGCKLVVDSSRLRAWWHHDEGASWSRCRGKASIS